MFILQLEATQTQRRRPCGRDTMDGDNDNQKARMHRARLDFGQCRTVRKSAAQRGSLSTVLLLALGRTFILQLEVEHEPDLASGALELYTTSQNELP